MHYDVIHILFKRDNLYLYLTGVDVTLTLIILILISRPDTLNRSSLNGIYHNVKKKRTRLLKNKD